MYMQCIIRLVVKKFIGTQQEKNKFKTSKTGFYNTIHKIQKKRRYRSKLIASTQHFCTVFKQKLHPFYFCNTFTSCAAIDIVLFCLTCLKIATKRAMYFALVCYYKSLSCNTISESGLMRRLL